MVKTSRRVFVGAAILGLALVTSRLQAQANLPLLDSSSLVHLGSFHVPWPLRSGGQANLGFEYGGTALSFNPANNSLFLVGHDWDQLVGEISIPALGGTATLLQPLVEATEGLLYSVTSNTSSKKIGGTLVSGGTLILTGYDYYDVTTSQTVSHFTRPTTLSIRGQVKGPLKVGPLNAGYYDGYMGWIPPEWQSVLGGKAMTGQSDVPGIYRTSSGPAAFAFDPANITGGVQPLVYYPIDHPTLGAWGQPATPFYSGADTLRGVVFPAGTASVLFFGKHGTTYCYGPGTGDQSKAGQPATDIGDSVDKYCYDPVDTSKGNHGYPYVTQVWAYNANDLALVRRGQRRPWDVTPYAVWSLPGVNGYEIGGAAYDPVSGRIYVSQMYGEHDALPLIHVFSIGGSGSTPNPPRPAAPVNFRVLPPVP